jgi:hypothetical protein
MRVYYRRWDRPSHFVAGHRARAAGMLAGSAEIRLGVLAIRPSDFPGVGTILVAHALVRAASRLISTPALHRDNPSDRPLWGRLETCGPIGDALWARSFPIEPETDANANAKRSHVRRVQP